MQTPTLKRIQSVDTFRALTMVAMIFVNDFWTLTGIPYWLQHAEADVDFLGVSDVVFPCFLFILGMAIPFAIQNRLAKGDTHPQILVHIISRSVALIIMGLFTVNVPEINEEATGMSKELFKILMVVAFFLVWNLYPIQEPSPKYLFKGLQVLGVGILVYLAFIFKGNSDGKLVGFETKWWGILGLIGWTYLSCAIIYLLAFPKPIVLVISWAIFSFLPIAGHAGWLKTLWPSGPQDWILANGAFHSFAFMGIMATLLLEWFQEKNRKIQIPSVFTIIGIGLIVIGILLHNFFIISKIQATPTWIFLCSGIAFILYASLFFLLDLQDKGRWFQFIRTAGTSTLTCYVLPYVYYSVVSFIPFRLPSFLTSGGVGLIKSFLFSLLIVGIATLLGRLQVKLKI